MTSQIMRKLAAEWVGTAFLLGTIVGSGIMADALSDDVAVTLLGHSIPTGAILFVMISLLGPISGAHFNPAVTMVFALRRDISIILALGYVGAQIAGGIVGVFIAHAMFELPILQIATTVRTGSAQWLAEIVATFGLVLTILGGLRYRPSAVPALVGFYITAAIWFTASTSLANPAVTLARAITDTFTGIRPLDAPAFIIAQLVGAALCFIVARWLLSEPNKHPE